MMKSQNSLKGLVKISRDKCGIAEMVNDHGFHVYAALFLLRESKRSTMQQDLKEIGSNDCLMSQ